MPVVGNVNECDGNHGCSQNCEDRIAGHVCTCLYGYKLDKDQKTCIGESVAEKTQVTFGFKVFTYCCAQTNILKLLICTSNYYS